MEEKTLWNENIEKMITDIGNSCKGYKFMCILSSSRESKKYDILMYSLLTITPLSGTFSAISISFPEQTVILQILITFFAMLAGLFTAIVKFSKFDQKATAHKNIATKYASLENNIRRQLSLSRSSRVNCSKYLEWVTTSFDDLFGSTPLIPDDIYTEWTGIAMQNNISVPKELTTVITDKHIDTDIYSDNPIVIKQAETDKQPEQSNHKKQDSKTRGIVYEPIFDINKFSDGRMKYEMYRLKD